MTTPLAVLLLLPGCGLFAQPEYADYYADEDEAPAIESVEPDSERGNVGGQEVTIRGRDFGEDAADLVVQFGDRNADIVEVTDDTLVVRAPAGPMSGGSVRVRVGSAGGFDDGSYTYDVAFDDGFPLDEQVGYIQVSNYWWSCYGGLGSSINGCETFAYIGYAGLDGYARALGFPYPRLEAPFIGFGGAGDLGSETWTVTRNYQYPFAVGIEELYIDPGPISMTNLTLATIEEECEVDELVEQEDGSLACPAGSTDGADPYCADLDALATYRYPGGDRVTKAVKGLGNTEVTLDPVTVGGTGVVTGMDRSDYEADLDPETPKSSAAKEEAEDERQAEEAAEQGKSVDELFPCEAYPWEPTCEEYDRHELHFCQRDDELGLPTFEYRADWPIARDFFSDGDDREDLPITVRVRADDIGLDAELPLPPPIELAAKQGFGDSSGLNAWSVGTMDACFARRGREETLDDDAIRFQWQSAGTDFDPGQARGGVSGSRTYVRVTLTYFAYGWFGVTGYPVRATIAVPDDYGSDGDGVSVLNIPSEVLYQFPSFSFPAGGQSGFGGFVYETYAPNLGFLVLTAERITEYLVDTDVGSIVFSYSTGDLGFYEWSNPTDGSCHDCADDDEDGWTDAADPDCAANTATAELGYGTTACNDGIDNDGDGREDADDPDCADALDDDESE